MARYGFEPLWVTKEWVDIVCPEHGRTSCSDTDLGNVSGGWNGKFDENTGKKVIQYPRCNRCYLLDHLNEKFDDLAFAVEVEVRLEFRDKK